MSELSALAGSEGYEGCGDDATRRSEVRRPPASLRFFAHRKEGMKCEKSK